MTVTDAGLNLFRDAWTGTGTTIQGAYMAFGTGFTKLTAQLNNGTPYTSLAVSALPAAVSAGDELQLVDVNNNVATVTVDTGGAAPGATSVPISSFTPSQNWVVDTAVIRKPGSGDTSLDNENFRVQLLSFVNGGNAGQSVNTYYVAPNVGNVQIAEVAVFAGPSVTSTVGTGTMVMRAPYGHDHTTAESLQDTVDFTF
jgi:hypothetical protein